MISTNQEKITELLTRGVANVYPTPEFLDKELKSGRQLTLYTGYDPTGPSLHIGHGITMLKLRQFQDLGHKIIMLIGDFTAMIGDPTDKSAARTRLTREEVLENCKKYQEQASSILNFTGENPVEVKYNSEWLEKMNFADVVELASHFTVQQILERDMFEKRLRGEIQCVFCDTRFIQPYLTRAGLSTTPEGVDFPKITKCPNPNCNRTVQEMLDEGAKDKEKYNDKMSRMYIPQKPIFLHEFLYPLMQGKDSVEIVPGGVDGEVGGNDQTFNMLAGRTLVKEICNKEKFVYTVKLLTDENGKKMGKSEGNMIALADSPEDMFGKVMTWGDGVIRNSFELCTRLPMNEIDEIMKAANPRDAKLKLAFTITETFLGKEAAEQGRDYFTKTIQNKERPDEIPELKPSEYDIVTVLVEAGFLKSKSEAKREIDGGGVKINDQKVTDYEALVKSGDVVQKGKRFFVTVK